MAVGNYNCIQDYTHMLCSMNRGTDSWLVCYVGYDRVKSMCLASWDHKTVLAVRNDRCRYVQVNYH